MHAICVCARGALSSFFERKVLDDSLEREREGKSLDEGCLEAFAIRRDGESKRENIKNLTEHNRTNHICFGVFQELFSTTD